MTCPSCQRDNHPRRRYCGGCGCNFEPACDRCGFGNDRDDRFCGGCGLALRATGTPARVSIPIHIDDLDAGPPPAAAARAPTAASSTTSPWDASELAELFTPAAPVEELPDLPDAGIGQGDVDRLFGGVP